MNERDVVRIRHVDPRGRDQAFLMHEQALIHELVHGDHLPPETQIWLDGEWIRLSDHPAPVWLGLMAEQAVAAVGHFDAIGTQRWADKILRYSGGGRGEEHCMKRCGSPSSCSAMSASAQAGIGRQPGCWNRRRAGRRGSHQRPTTTLASPGLTCCIPKPP